MIYIYEKVIEESDEMTIANKMHTELSEGVKCSHVEVKGRAAETNTRCEKEREKCERKESNNRILK